MEQFGDKTGKYGGSVREAGGAFGSMAAARENEYFKRIDEQKIEELKKKSEEKKIESKDKNEK